VPRLVWPLPALLAWGACWALFIALSRLAAPLPVALALAVALGLVLALPQGTRWRRLFVAAGFPLSLAASGLAAPLPAWAWLVALGALVLLYPLNTWRDAPMFPTPHGGLNGLASLAPLHAGAQVLDAGCGLGDGLRELRREYPLARIAGVEWSWPLRLVCALRCRFARVTRGDLWASDWSQQDLVYLAGEPGVRGARRAAHRRARDAGPQTGVAVPRAVALRRQRPANRGGRAARVGPLMHCVTPVWLVAPLTSPSCDRHHARHRHTSR
jgi:hypothetical protein